MTMLYNLYKNTSKVERQFTGISITGSFLRDVKKQKRLVMEMNQSTDHTAGD